jgi:8-oxo-dGTP pyrophosphatase MutT (NUDIX family)
MDTRGTTVVKPAATVVLVRDSNPGLEVFLVRRHAGLAFMGGAHVFPGGQVDDSDRMAARMLTSSGTSVNGSARMADVDPEAALAFHVAAVRETVEEAGIRVAVDALVYFAWWVTPEQEDRRFDTRFFLAPAPVHQGTIAEGGETTERLWLRPAEALDRCSGGEITLPPPTWTTLRWLEPFEGVNAALDWAQTKRVQRIQPVIVERADARLVTLPDVAVPPHVAVETRFLLKGGRWYAE